MMKHLTQCFSALRRFVALDQSTLQLAASLPSSPCWRLSSSGAAQNGSTEELFVGGYTPITKQLWAARHAAAANRDTGASSASTSADSKPPKQTAVTYNFTTDKVLAEMYRNPWSAVRIGRLLEDLDSLAGNVAFEHCYRGVGELPLLVTASVDEIHLRKPLTLSNDIAVAGQVVWTGRSSLDIRMQLFQAGSLGLEGLFSFVHLDPKTRKASPVVQLEPATQDEKQAFLERQRVADARRAARQARGDPDSVPLPAVAREWIQAARRMQELPALAGDGVVLLPATSLANTFICQPQNRNPHGRIFGGFLMRRAYELGFATTYMFAGNRPVFVKVDEITFNRPVDVGSLLRLHSAVMHTQPLSEEQGRVVVEVEARVTKPETVDSFVSNTFRFVFDAALQRGAKLKRVLPTTEEEAQRCWRAQQEDA